MKPLNDNHYVNLIDGLTSSHEDSNELATSDLIDTACKKLSLLNYSQQSKPLPQPAQQLPDTTNYHHLNYSANNTIILHHHGLANAIGNNTTAYNTIGLQQQQQQPTTILPRQQPATILPRQQTRKASFFSTTSTNLGNGKSFYLKNQQNGRVPFSTGANEKSKLLHHEDTSYFPIRYIIIVMSTLATFVSYTIRVNMSVTLVAMVNQSNKLQSSNDQLSLSNSSNSQQPNELAISTTNLTNPSPLQATAIQSGVANLDWSESIQGVALGAFYWGFIITHVLGGQLANIFSARIICACSIITASLLTLLLPLAANFSVYAVIMLRMVTGLCLGIVAPALYTLSSRWVPQSERSTSIAIRMIGGNMGAVTAMSISGYLSDLTGWESVFYVIGGFGCVIFVLWIYLVSDSPQQHRWIGEHELEFIQNNTDCMSSSQAKSIKLDWVSMLISPKLWAVAIAKFCGSWGNLMLMQKLPTYLETVLQMPIGKNGLVNAIVYIAMSVSLFVFGCLSDYVCTNQQRSHRTTTRVLFELIALLGPAICLAFVPFVGHSQDAVISLLIVAMILYGLTAGGDNPIVVEIAPDFPGTMYGVTNAIASIPGFLAPIIVGCMLDSNNSSNQHQWNMIFFITSGIYALGAIAFMLMADADVQPWGVADFRKKEQLEKRHKRRQQQLLQNSSAYYYDYDDDDDGDGDTTNEDDLTNTDKKNLLDEEANCYLGSISSRSDRNHQQQQQQQQQQPARRRSSRFENSINLLEQHHFNIGSFTQDSSMRVRNI